VTKLHFNDFDLALMQIFQPMFGTKRNIAGSTPCKSENFTVNGYGCGATHHSPMLGAVLVALQGQAATFVNRKTFDLEARFLIEHMKSTPRAGFAIHAMKISDQQSLRQLTFSTFPAYKHLNRLSPRTVPLALSRLKALKKH
jgi:hypothetical protein